MSFADAVAVTETSEKIRSWYPNHSGTDRAFVAHLIVRHGHPSDVAEVGAALFHVTDLRAQHAELHETGQHGHRHQ